MSILISYNNNELQKSNIQIVQEIQTNECNLEIWSQMAHIMLDIKVTHSLNSTHLTLNAHTFSLH